MSETKGRYATLASVVISKYTNDDGSQKFNLKTNVDLTTANGVVIPAGSYIPLATPLEGAPDFVKYNAILNREKFGISGDL